MHDLVEFSEQQTQVSSSLWAEVVGEQDLEEERFEINFTHKKDELNLEVPNMQLNDI